MGRCSSCGATHQLISSELGVCLECIRGRFDQVWPEVSERHRRSRREFGLPEFPPREKGGLRCGLCQNLCRVKKAEPGYCGIVVGDRSQGYLSWYYDNLPTNCVAELVCPAGTGCGFPEYSYRPGAEYGYKNLAVFYQSCSFNCLFCQNWHFRKERRAGKGITAAELASGVDSTTACICYFGGDPATQLPHSIETSRLALRRREGEILRICWETNGSMNPRLLEEIAEIAFNSGGCIKFDLKAFDEKVHRALTGVSNRRTLDNFVRLSRRIKERLSPPFLVASTLLVPGYVERREIAEIARFIARLDPEIPYSLLAFHPGFLLYDLPTTSRSHASACLEAARDVGLKHVHLGNAHLLGDDY